MRRLMFASALLALALPAWAGTPDPLHPGCETLPAALLCRYDMTAVPEGWHVLIFQYEEATAGSFLAGQGNVRHFDAIVSKGGLVFALGTVGLTDAPITATLDEQPFTLAPCAADGCPPPILASGPAPIPPPPPPCLKLSVDAAGQGTVTACP